MRSLCAVVRRRWFGLNQTVFVEIMCLHFFLRYSSVQVAQKYDTTSSVDYFEIRRILPLNKLDVLFRHYIAVCQVRYVHKEEKMIGRDL